MSKQRIVGTMAGIVSWLSESNATSREEDLDLALALQALSALPEEAFTGYQAASERGSSEDIRARRERISDSMFLKAAVFLDRNDAHVLDCTLETPDGDPVIAMDDEGLPVFALVRFMPAGQEKRADSEDLAAQGTYRRQTEKVAFDFAAEHETWKPGIIRFDVLQATVIENKLNFSLRKGVWRSDQRPSRIDARIRERLAELVSAYRGTGNCFEGCEIADEIAELLESELL